MGAKDFADAYLKLKVIPKAKHKEVQTLVGHHIIVINKDGDAICTSCNKKFKMPKAQHKADAICPKCHKDNMTILHAWRMSKYTDEYGMLIVPQMVDTNCVVLRYLHTERRFKKEDYLNKSIRNVKNTPWNTREVARAYYHENYANPLFYESTYSYIQKKSIWSRGKGHYFRPDTYSVLCRNRNWLGYAYHPTYKDIFDAFQNLECFKYYPLKDIWDMDSGAGIYQIIYLMRTARFNEKASKMGLQNLVEANRRIWDSSRSQDYAYQCVSCWMTGNKTVAETLKLSRPQIEILKATPTYEVRNIVDLLRSNPNITYTDIELCNFSAYTYTHVDSVVKKTHITRTKMMNYIHKHKLDISEYEHYLDLLEKLNYPLTDEYYSMPKDFRKADKKISDEYADKVAKERAKSFLDRLKGQADIDERIYQISKIIRDAKELRFWTHGSNGLKVIVPESVGELVDEGIHLHNCLQTYAEKIADKETLIFFIRRLDDPNKEYVAMEYRDGQRVQIRFDHNIEVEDEKILQFADAFAEKLKSIDVMEKIRKVS